MKSNIRVLSTSLLFLISIISLSGQIADKVFKNAKVYTTNNSFEEAIAIKDGDIIYVGSDFGVSAHIGAGTYVEDLNGKLVLPGLHDVHMHPLEASSPIGGGCILDNYETNPENFIPVLQNCNLSPNVNGWIMAFGHSIFTFFDGPNNARYPYEILDDVYPTTPAVVMEETSHSVWVNSAALTALGITASTPDPVGGHIVKDALYGNIPTGILLDNAGDLALAAALATHSTIDAANKAGLVNYGLPLLAQNGITSICEGRTYWKRNYHSIWQSIKDDGNLTCRVVLNPWVYPSDDDLTQIPMLQALYDTGDEMLKTTQIKLYADGIVINATSAMHEPYNYNWDLPFNTGLNYIDETRMTNLITILEQTGYDFHIHAIGDRGITESLDAIESARMTNGAIGARHRITHLEIVKATDLPRFPALNVTADMQVAGNFTNPNNWNENNFLVGASRTDSIIPLKAFHNAGARITLSSDWDVSSLNPYVAMKNALTRSPQELPDIETALQAYTIDAAYVMRQETSTGSLEVGKWADFIVVDRDVFTIPTNQISQTKTLLTYVGGDEVYRSSSLPLPVELLYFEVMDNGCNIHLEWATGSERNNEKFILERSSNGKSFKTIGIINGTGNSAESITYTFEDKEPMIKNYYRLRQIDFDGQEEISEMIFAQKNCAENLQVKLMPNITNYLTMIQLKGGSEEKVIAELLTSNGRSIKTFSIVHDGIATQSPLNVTFLPEGIYYLRIYAEHNQFSAMQTVVVSR